MKWLAIIGGIIFGVLALFLSDLLEHLVLFFLAGVVPFTNFTIPPLAMLLFWILVVPGSILLYRIFSGSVWRAVDILAVRMQRRINRRLRPVSRHASSPVALYVITLLYLADSLPKSTIGSPELSFRRRFLTLPQAS